MPNYYYRPLDNVNVAVDAVVVEVVNDDDFAAFVDTCSIVSPHL